MVVMMLAAAFSYWLAAGTGLADVGSTRYAMDAGAVEMLRPAASFERAAALSIVSTSAALSVSAWLDKRGNRGWAKVARWGLVGIHSAAIAINVRNGIEGRKRRP